MFACCSEAATRISRSNLLGGDRGRELGREELHDHATSEPVLLGDEDARHATAAELALEGVTTGERLLQARSEVGHYECAVAVGTEANV